MSFTRVELIFIAVGAALGAIAAYVLKAGWVAGSAGFPPFVWVLLGLGLVELLGGLATGSPPGGLVGMPARFIAFVVGVGVLVLIPGGLA